MLLPVSPRTARSKIYSELNNSFLGLLLKKITGATFDANIFPDIIKDALWENVPTREAFKNLWDACDKVQPVELEEFVQCVIDCQDIDLLSRDRSVESPKTPDVLYAALFSLGSILYKRTSNLAGIKATIDENAQSYYLAFRRENGCICRACGINQLSEWLNDVADEEQYRPPNDHFLSREHFPYFSVHPDNLIPVCGFCNEKTKGRNDVSRHLNGNRRLFPNPWKDSYADHVKASITRGEFRLEINFHFSDNLTGDNLEKAQVWDELFKPFSRVAGHIDDIPYRVDCLTSPNSLEDLNSKITQRSMFCQKNRNKEEYGYWYSILLGRISESPTLMGEIWETISADRRDIDFRELFDM